MSMLSIPFYILKPAIDTCLFKLASRRVVYEGVLAGTEIQGGWWKRETIPILFYLRVFMFWFDRESIISGNFGFAISVCRLRERGRLSKSVYVRV